VTTVDTVEEAKQILAEGFDYVTEKTASCFLEGPNASAVRVCTLEIRVFDAKL